MSDVDPTSSLGMPLFRPDITGGDREVMVWSLVQHVHDLRGTLAQAQEQVAQLTFEATHDALTGLPNLRGWQRIVDARRGEIEAGSSHAVVVTDLDEFKPINDKLGHARGNDVIQANAIAQVAAVRGTDAVIARPAGDETQQLLDMTQVTETVPGGARGKATTSDASTAERVQLVINRQKANFADYVQSQPDLRNSGVSMSAGFAISRPGVPVEQLVAEADAAAHQDKLLGLPDLTPEAVAELQTAKDILSRHGITTRRFPLYEERFGLE